MFWQVNRQPFPRVRVCWGLRKPNPYPYPAVPYPWPGQVLKPLPITSRAEERHLCRLRLRRSIPKSKPLSFLHILPLAAHSQQFTVSILNRITDLQKRFNQPTHWNALRNGLICHSSKFLKIVICRRLTFQKIGRASCRERVFALV